MRLNVVIISFCYEIDVVSRPLRTEVQIAPEPRKKLLLAVLLTYFG